MSRRPRQGLTPNLFPFLAVLVCTLGTLILLLALVAQKAEKSAEQLADSQAKSMRLQTDDQRWRAEELEKLRARQTAELENRRSELAHLEDHLRRLRQEMTELGEEATAANNQSDASSAQAELRLVSLRTEIDREKERLGELQQERAGRPPRVVIVPYRGTHGTDRRPIYVECTDQAVIIQPEGVRITAAHLEGPLGPGNPLDAALRAVREHWQKTDPESPPPYPLLLVRPGGIHAYAACRIAMTAWDDQFGYELISADLRLGFPEPDEALHDKLVQTIHEAAQRQQAKIAAMPRRYNALSRGGTAATEIGPGSSDGTSIYGRTPPGTPGNNIAGNDIAGNNIQGDGTAGNDVAGNGTAGDDVAENGLFGESESTGGEAGSGRGSGVGGNPPLTAGALRPPGNALTAGTSTAGNTTAESEPTGEGEPAAGDPRIAGDAAAGDGRGPAGKVAAAASNPLGGAGGTESRGQIAGGGGSTSAAAPPAGGGSAATAGLAPSSRASSMQLPPAFDPHAKTFSETAPPPDFNANRFQGDRRSPDPDDPPVLRAGNDWAIPASMSGGRGTAIVRQMRMRCEPNRFVLLPESRSGGSATIIAIGDGAAEPAVIELATALRDRVEGWGLAMQNGRWEPVLVVTVAAGAESRFEQLQVLFRGSGIRVQREAPE